MKAIYLGDGKYKSKGFSGRVFGKYKVGAFYEVVEQKVTDKIIKVIDEDGYDFGEDSGFFQVIPDDVTEAPSWAAPKAIYAPWVFPKAPDDISTRHAIKTQKQIGAMVLDQLSIIDPNCIIAGGAPRNWDMGKVANDIDVYLYVGETHSCSSLLRALKKLFGADMIPMGLTAMELNDVSAKERLECPYDAMDIRWVFEGNVMGTTVQFIVMKAPTFNSVVDRFDSSICKVWFDGKHIVETNEYKRTKETGVIFINDPDGRQNRHLDKMYKYFGELGYVFTTDKYNGRTKVERSDVKNVWFPSMQVKEQITF